jgi:hypothetical protein
MKTLLLPTTTTRKRMIVTTMERHETSWHCRARHQDQQDRRAETQRAHRRGWAWKQRVAT